MAAAGADTLMDAELQALQEKKQTVRSIGQKVISHLEIERQIFGVEITLSRDKIVYVGSLFFTNVCASDNDWNRVLSEGLGTAFTVDWWHPAYVWADLRELEQGIGISNSDPIVLGEAIFSVMRTRGLFPAWNGTREGEMTVTVVDEAGAKLALAMALHPRLGSGSSLSHVSSLALVLCSCTKTMQLPKRLKVGSS